MHIFLYYTGLIAFSLMVIVSLGATIIPVFRSKEWYVRMFDYPRLQTFTIAVVALCWYLLLYYRPGRNANIIIVAFAIIILVQAYKAWPYTPLAPKQVPLALPGDGYPGIVSLYISNVLQSNDQYHLTLQEITKYQPDLVITTETEKPGRSN